MFYDAGRYGFAGFWGFFAVSILESDKTDDRFYFRRSYLGQFVVCDAVWQLEAEFSREPAC